MRLNNLCYVESIFTLFLIWNSAGMKSESLTRCEADRLASLLNTARRKTEAALMVDIKCRSARDQQLIDPDRIADYVAVLVAAGVKGFSVVTEPRHFGGSLALAAHVRKATELPLIRKEFWSRLNQIDESAAIGFDAVQLTISVIKDLDLVARMANRATQLGLEFIICVQSAAELEQALALGATIIGINNRDILSLETDDGTVSRTELLMPWIPRQIYVISESSMLAPRDVKRAVAAGADGVLVGTAFAKASDPAALVRDFRKVMTR